MITTRVLMGHPSSLESATRRSGQSHDIVLWWDSPCHTLAHTRQWLSTRLNPDHAWIPLLASCSYEIVSLVMVSVISSVLWCMKRFVFFTYRPRCLNLKICCLGFAGGPLYIERADSSSLYSINEVLVDFDLYSGLNPNLQKCAVFIGGG